MIELLRNRRSIRKFTNQNIEQEKLDLLNEAILRSPSSRGKNPWEFIVVTDSDILDKLSSAKHHGSEFVKGASVAYVICADTDKADAWIEDCSIAGILLQLTAESLGLGSCWAQIRKRPHNSNLSAEDYLKELLQLPANYAVESIIGIGYADGKLEGHPMSSLQTDKIHSNKY